MDIQEKLIGSLYPIQEIGTKEFVGGRRIIKAHQLANAAGFGVYFQEDGPIHVLSYEAACQIADGKYQDLKEIPL